MASRPVFTPADPSNRDTFVVERSVDFTWHPGLAPVQKKKNIAALHRSAAEAGLPRLLEVSSKSEEEVGRRLSAFSLKVDQGGRPIPLECAFQGSKVFEQGGPFTDLYERDSRDAKKDARLRESGPLRGFTFEGKDWPLVPKTAFYDWLYLRALQPHQEWLTRLFEYDGFTDIEFNPARSINCQARSLALFVALLRRGIVDEALASPEAFIGLTARDSSRQPHSEDLRQQRLL